MIKKQSRPPLSIERLNIVISDNILPRCGHHGWFTMLADRHLGEWVGVVICRECEATWQWGNP